MTVERVRKGITVPEKTVGIIIILLIIIGMLIVGLNIFQQTIEFIMGAV